MTETAAPRTTKRHLAEMIADSDIRLGVWSDHERDACITRWMKESKARLLTVVETRQKKWGHCAA